MNHPAISPDGKWVVTTPWQGKGIKVWASHSGELQRDLWPECRNGMAAFSPDGRWLVTGSADEYRIWQVGSWQFSHRISCESIGGVRGQVAFSRDGTVLAISHSTWSIKLVDPRTGDEFVTLPTRFPNPGLCFSSDGGELAMRGVHGSIDVWNLRMIRDQLAAMGLDWQLPAYSPPTATEATEPLSAQVSFGDHAELYLAKARWHTSRKEYRDAIRNLRQCIELNSPHAPAACNSLAWILANGPTDARNPDEALPLALRAVESTPRNAYYLNTLGVVYYRLGKYDAAIEQLLEAGKHQPHGATAWDYLSLAMSYHRVGEFKQAHESYAKAMRWCADQPDLTPSQTDELTGFRAEAEAVLASSP